MIAKHIQPLILIIPRKNFHDKILSSAEWRGEGQGLGMGMKKLLKVDKQGVRNTPYFVCKGAHIRHEFLFHMVNSPIAEERIKLLNWCGALIIVTKYSKFGIYLFIIIY